ncbi:MAG: hypothetical protein HC880_03950 [Bacteroidia bacterium]|nr:hypothetical protein [Bacteroidia bacterium]
MEKLEYDPKKKCGYSNELLFREYLRRLTRLYVLSGSPERFDPGCYLHLIKEEIEDLNDLNDQVNNFVNSEFPREFGLGGYFLVHCFLKWEVHKKFLPLKLPSELVDLYEPLLRIF